MVRVSAAFAALAWLAPLVAHAAPSPVTFPDWVSVPGEEALDYPQAPKGSAEPPSGTAVVKCHRHENGDLDHCNVVSETPKGLGFGWNAAVAATLSRAPSPPESAVSPDGDVTITISFNGPAAATAARAPRPKGTVVTNPDWKRKPSGNDLMGLYPVDALRSGREGKATVACYVSAEGLLDRCRIVSESPDGQGFGPAALLATRYFTMQPKIVDGQPVAGAVVVIPITFAGAVNGGGFYPAVDKVLSASLWAETPTLAMMDAAFPKAAANVKIGHVVLRCGVARDGRLKDCQESVENPLGHGFATAAKAMAKAFRLNVDDYPDIHVWEAKVDLPVTFYAPGYAQSDPITDPFWTRMIDPTAAQRLFPGKAADAGVKSGRGVVDCVVDHAGQLTACQAVGESPAALGFGDAAVSVASVMAINPWTPQGRPVDGAHIRLPLVLKLSPTDAAPATAAKP